MHALAATGSLDVPSAVCAVVPPSPLAELSQIALSLDALNCGAVLVGRNGIIAHVNPRFCEMIARPRSELIGAELVGLYPSNGDESRAMIQRLLADFDRPREAEFALPLPEGKRLPVIFSARPVGSDGILGEYAVITVIDLTKQKLAEQRLLEQNQAIGELSDRVIEQALILREQNETLEKRVRERTAQLNEAYIETVYMLAIASEAKDEDTGAHVRRIGRLSQAIALQLGMSETEAERIGWSAVLHDVGKIHTPDRVLKKPGPLTPQERERMKQHTLAGERIMRPSSHFAQASRIARSHHENWDGSGYPDATSGEQIPLEARIVHLADVYDALTHPRVYKEAWDRAVAMEEIHRNRGRMFDPNVVDAFERLEQTGGVKNP
jgi:putative two-component system response regulator